MESNYTSRDYGRCRQQNLLLSPTHTAGHNAKIENSTQNVQAHCFYSPPTHKYYNIPIPHTPSIARPFYIIPLTPSSLRRRISQKEAKKRESWHHHPPLPLPPIYRRKSHHRRRLSQPNEKKRRKPNQKQTNDDLETLALPTPPLSQRRRRAVKTKRICAPQQSAISPQPKHTHPHSPPAHPPTDPTKPPPHRPSPPTDSGRRCNQSIGEHACSEWGTTNTGTPPPAPDSAKTHHASPPLPPLHSPPVHP